MSRLTKGVLYLTGLVVVGLLSFYGGRLSIKPHTVSELSPIFIYDKEDLLELSIEDIGKYHGDVCPCVAVAFRATQLAISKLWEEEIPRRKDFRIITRCPTQGTQDAFEFITRAKTGKNREGDFRIELPEGTSFENLSADNFAFIFIRKSTGDSLEVQVKEEIFPEGFFKLMNKVKSGKAAQKEKKEFENAKDELKHRYLNLPVDEVFVFNGE
ncbi:hypothetical protein CH333_07750 [candidate division WOR-3 bacterium JGI_Cruoil_03_44_89]|uniref:Formylmethanofuran dehydrogenase subunit E domain-containing protein n=1 Tax=candidate division WOR-3 bacterium JGI_Cruoil_03_44_89 TaxID=1973748 RepID=A0A235BR86_UNCW3|nr:MAG: hypothetical protein CH333_07750 [candidate division WOR-3 bacterium JGI_Cruoil_03_44_89]